jgi:hypothetical protein
MVTGSNPVGIASIQNSGDHYSPISVNEKGHPVSGVPLFHQNSLERTASHEARLRGILIPIAKRCVVPFGWLVSIARNTVIWRVLLYLARAS